VKFTFVELFTAPAFIRVLNVFLIVVPIGLCDMYIHYTWRD